MNNQQAMKKFAKLMAKYDFDPRDGIDYRYQDAIELGVEVEDEVFACNILGRKFDYSLIKEDKDRPTAFSQVVFNCAQIMMLAMSYYKNQGIVANWSQSDAEDGGSVLRAICLAYELYWHLNVNLVLRHAMNKIIDAGFYTSSILHDAATLSHPRINLNAHKQAFSVVSEIASLFLDYDGELPSKNQRALKPELLAVKNQDGQWALPTSAANVFLIDKGRLQVIQGGAFTIELDYTQAAIDMDEGPDVVGGIIYVEYRNQRIAASEHRFSIDLDRNNGYQATADYWGDKRRMCLPDLLRGKEVGAKKILQHQVQLDEMLLEACNNILKTMLLNEPEIDRTVHQTLYCDELSSHGFGEIVFSRLNPCYLDAQICSTVVWKNYRCLKFLPAHFRADLKIGLQALDGANEYDLDAVWGALYFHTEIPLEELATVYAPGGFGLPGTPKRLPKRIKTPAFLSTLVSKFPAVLDYMDNSAVFSCLDEIDEFLDREQVGLKKVFHDIISVGNKTPSEAYLLALKVLELADKPVELPIF